MGFATPGQEPTWKHPIILSTGATCTFRNKGSEPTSAPPQRRAVHLQVEPGWMKFVPVSRLTDLKNLLVLHAVSTDGDF